ncbi:MAG: T9SS type A sorting domain-containing protein [Bacteroidia bacterium]
MATFRALRTFTIFLLLGNIAFAQGEAGSLFGINHLGADAGFFVIDYPNETFSLIDSGTYQDLCLIDSFLYTASRGTSSSENIIYQYHIPSRQVTDSFALAAKRLIPWQNQLLVLCEAPPYVRVFDPQQSWNLSLQLDTNLIALAPQEAVADGDKAYLLYGQSIRTISFSQADTLKNVPTPHVFPSVGYNTSLSQDANNLYIGVDYATGAIRTSMLQLDKSNDSVKTAFHRDFRGFFAPPVPYLDRVLVYLYSDYYDIAQDSLYEFVHVLTETVISADTSSQQLFIWDVLNRRLSVEHQSQRSNGIGLNHQPGKAIWTSADQSVAIESKLAWSFKAYPNPVAQSIVVEFPTREPEVHMTLIDVSGRLVAERYVYQQQRVEWELPASIPAHFILRIRAGDGRSASRIIQREE